MAALLRLLLASALLLALAPSVAAAQDAGGAADAAGVPAETAPAAEEPAPVADALAESLELVEEQPRRLWQTLRKIWNYQITSTDEASITIGMIIGAFVVFLVGFLLARFLSALLARRVFPRFGMDRGAAATFQALAFYVLLAIFALFALQWANIPLTIFTVAGGALAIGVGFGSQNIVNNFISGLILMAERPIKIGDLVDVAGVQGVVEQIGARSTRVQSGDNTHVIVPNSKFLEQDVHNWTLSDNEVRTSVDVGVAYGSPIEQVRELLLQAITEQRGVKTKPAPEVLFMDFGDNSLLFRGYFWMAIKRPLDRHRMQSVVRFRVDELFREAGITIAFPQRDVHIDSLSPLEIRLLDGGRKDGRGAPGP